MEAPPMTAGFDELMLSQAASYLRVALHKLRAMEDPNDRVMDADRIVGAACWMVESELERRRPL